MFPPSYLHASVGPEDGTDLVVVLSAGPYFGLRDHPFGCRTLLVRAAAGGGVGSQYYMTRCGRAVDALLAEMDARGHRRCILVGVSKGGFGALLWGTIAARRRPDLAFGVLAVCPQTRLWPSSATLDIASYRAMCRRAREGTALRRQLERHGDVSSAGSLSRLAVTLVYGARNAMDVAEADRIRGPRVWHVAPDTDIHGGLLLHRRPLSGEAELRTAIAGLRRHAPADADLATVLGNDDDEALLARLPADRPDLDRLLADLRARCTQPVRPRAAARALRRVRSWLRRRSPWRRR